MYTTVLSPYCFFFFIAVFAWSDGTTFDWDEGGASDNDWTNTNNWVITGGTGNAYPDSDLAGTDIVIFDPSSATTTSPQAGCTIASLTVNGNGTVTPAGFFEVTGNTDCDGVITSDAAGITFGGQVIGGGTINASTGTTTFSGDLGITTYNEGNGTEVFDGTTDLGGVYTFNDIEITGILDTNERNLTVQLDITGTGTLQSTGGGPAEVITVGRNFTVATFDDADENEVIFNTANTSSISAQTFWDLTLSKAAGGNVTFNGDLDVDNSMTVNSNNYDVSLYGGTNNIVGNPDFNNDGTLNLGVGGDDFTFPDGFSATTPSPTTINLNCDIITSDDAVVLGNVNLSGNTTITTAGGTLSIGTIDGGSDLNIDTTGGANTGAIAFNGAIGGGPDPDNFTVNSKAAVELQSTSITGDLTVTAGGDITQTAATSITVGGTSNLNAGAGEITLTEANDFTGAVELSNSGANDVQVVDAAGLNLGTSNVGGNLIATATTGNVSDSGTVTVAGYGSFTTSAAGADINLGTLAVTGEVRLSTNGVGGDATVVDSGGLVFGPSSVGGALDATAGGGDLTQTAATNISVGGTADFTAPGGNNVYLGEANSFGNTVTFSSGGTLNDVTVQDTTALELGGLGINGNLNVTSGGSITQSGALAVTGTSDFTLTSGTTDILLELGNTFGSTITFTDNGNIQDLSFRKDAGAAGFPAIPAGPPNLRDLTVVWNTGFTMPAVTVTGVMSLSGGGAVDQSGAIVAPSLVLLGAGSYDLTNAGNDVDTLAASTGGFIDFFDSDGLTVGSVAGTDGITTSDDDVTLTTGAALDITHAVAVGAGDLTLDAAGAVTHSAALSGAGLELLGTGGYTLNSVANSFTTIAGNVTNDVLYEDGGGIAIGTVNTVGLSVANVTITTAGDITQSQAISTANGSFTAGANVITLNNGG